MNVELWSSVVLVITSVIGCASIAWHAGALIGACRCNRKQQAYLKQCRRRRLSPDEEIANLHYAFEWSCPACGADNVVRLVETSPGEALHDGCIKAGQAMDVRVDTQASIAILPMPVRCNTCDCIAAGVKFPTSHLWALSNGS